MPLNFKTFLRRSNSDQPINYIILYLSVIVRTNVRMHLFLSECAYFKFIILLYTIIVITKMHGFPLAESIHM